MVQMNMKSHVGCIYMQFVVRKNPTFKYDLGDCAVVFLTRKNLHTGNIQILILFQILP